MRCRPRVLLVLLAAFALTACGQEVSAPGAGTQPESGGAPAATLDPALLDFTADTVDGGQVDGAELAGQDLVLWFWAPW